MLASKSATDRLLAREDLVSTPLKVMAQVGNVPLSQGRRLLACITGRENWSAPTLTL